MKRVSFAVFVLVAAGLGYRAYANGRVPHPADAQARDLACKEISACSQPKSIQTTAFVRTYVFEGAEGDVLVECRWSALMFGALRCRTEVRRERAPEYEGAYPDAIERSAPAH